MSSLGTSIAQAGTRPSGLGALLNPRGVAVVGASPRVGSAGGRVLRHMVDYNFSGGIFPVNPGYEDMFGLCCYRSVQAIDADVDLAVICTAPSTVAGVTADCLKAGIGAVIVHADGFDGPGQPTLQAALGGVGHGTALRVLGPNTNGLRVYPSGLFADASSGLVASGVQHGPVAVITQSGGVGGYFAATYLRRRRLAPKYLIDTGNEFDIDAAECLRHLATDDEIATIGLILEGCRDGRSLAEATRFASSRGKRVLMLRLATNSVSLAAAESHTGAVAGRFDVFRQILTDAGATICERPRTFADALTMSAARRAPRGNRMGVVTPSGGFGVLAADLGIERGLIFPQPELAASAAVHQSLGTVDPGNPLDVSATYTGSSERIRSGIEFLSGQPNIDSVVVWHPHGLLLEDRAAELLGNITAAARGTDKPIFHCGAAADPIRVQLIDEANVLSYESPDDLVMALDVFVGESAKRVGGLPGLAQARSDGHQSLAVVATRGTERIIGREAADLLSASGGISFVRAEVVRSSSEARACADRLGRPIVLKGEVPGLVHKSELGLVLGPVSGGQVEAAFEQLARRCIELGGVVTAEQAVTGVELALGSFLDASFGPVVMLAAGGRLVELFEDARFSPAPVSAVTAREMLTALRLYPLLVGYRGAEPSDMDAAVNAVVAFSELVAQPDFDYEVDINPIIVGPRGSGAVAVDAILVRRDREIAKKSPASDTIIS